MTQKERIEKPSSQESQNTETEPMGTDQTSDQPQKPPEPQNIIFKVEKEPVKKPLIHFEKRTTDKKSDE